MMLDGFAGWWFGEWLCRGIIKPSLRIMAIIITGALCTTKALFIGKTSGWEPKRNKGMEVSIESSSTTKSWIYVVAYIYLYMYLITTRYLALHRFNYNNDIHT